MNTLTENKIKIVTLEELNYETWDARCAIIEDDQTSIGFIKWTENKEQIYDFQSLALIRTSDIKEISRYLSESE